jgi:hypothetical protein
MSKTLNNLNRNCCLDRTALEIVGMQRAALCLAHIRHAAIALEENNTKDFTFRTQPQSGEKMK